MSRATRWILVGFGLLAVAGFIGAGGVAEDEPSLLVFAVIVGLPGLFAIQIGVVALAVKIGTHELLQAVRGPQKPLSPPQRSHAEPMRKLGDV